MENAINKAFFMLFTHYTKNAIVVVAFFVSPLSGTTKKSANIQEAVIMKCQR